MILALGGAGAAQADPQPLRAADDAIGRAVFARSERRGAETRTPGVARTSVDRRFAARGLTASAGFLCGIQPGAERDGGAVAYGVDPHGRFIGTKLSLAF